MYVSILSNPPYVRFRVPYTNIIHHHLIEATGAERALNYIRNSLCREDYHRRSEEPCSLTRRRKKRTVLVPDIRAGYFLSTQEQSAVSGLAKHGGHSFDLKLVEYMC